MFSRAALALALALGIAPALAAPANMSDADKATFKRYCTGDYLTYCGNLDPDGPEVSACFKANKAKLNPNCSAAIDHFAKVQRQARQAVR